MLRTTLYSYFHFGTVVRFLQDARPGHRLLDDRDGGRRIRSNLRLLFTYMTDLGLQESLRSEAAASLRELLEQMAQADATAVLTAQQFRALDTSIDAVRITLEKELRGMYAYSLTLGRLLSPDVRIEDTAWLAAPDAEGSSLPSTARLHVTEAARCLASELPTAAAFHLTRGVDIVMRAFYLSSASARRKVDHNELFERLDRIRADFANPLQHPSNVFTVDEAHRLWELSVDVINRIAPGLDINAKGRREKPPALTDS